MRSKLLRATDLFSHQDDARAAQEIATKASKAAAKARSKESQGEEGQKRDELMGHGEIWIALIGSAVVGALVSLPTLEEHLKRLGVRRAFLFGLVAK